MSQETQTLKFSQDVQASPAQIFHAFSNATAFREWLSDSSQADPKVGGRLYLWWNSGYYTAGEYLSLESDRSVAFTWHGRGEPGASQVQVVFEALDRGTRVSLEHSGIGAGTEWSKACDEIQQGWTTGLENLASVLETGKDLRFVLRPMLGVLVSDFNAEIATHLGVPVNEGVRLDGTVEGMGARAAGLLKDDVIVGMDGRAVLGYPDLTGVLQSHRAGDRVEVDFYRGNEKKTTNMLLSGRPVPELPAAAEDFAAQVRSILAEQQAGLEQLFEGASEADAEQRPEPGEWNAKEILAHLILGERDNSAYITDLIAGQERWSDNYAGNSHERTRAVVSVYPTVRELLEELKRTNAETCALLEALPDDFVARKGSYWRLAYGMTQAPFHTQLHYDQIRAAIVSARS